ncbi:MAG: hypothetical protein HRU17_07885 [Polyangiaceae bacterium]|nr:hypothetical protein [Polyangiaceae bacterium]
MKFRLASPPRRLRMFLLEKRIELQTIDVKTAPYFSWPRQRYLLKYLRK